MKPGTKLQYKSPSLMLVHSGMIKNAIFHRYGRKVKGDRFVLVWVERDQTIGGIPKGTYRLISICESQII